MKDCFVLFRDYTDENGLHEVEFVEVCETEAFAKEEVEKYMGQMPDKGDPGYDANESYWYQKEPLLSQN